MELFPVLPFSHTGCATGPASAITPPRSDPRLIIGRPTANGTSSKPAFWATTTTAGQHLPLHLVGPGEQSENQEEDEDDLELESDEDHSKLRLARARPGAEDGSPAAKGGDGTINPPFP